MTARTSPSRCMSASSSPIPSLPVQAVRKTYAPHRSALCPENHRTTALTLCVFGFAFSPRVRAHWQRESLLAVRRERFKQRRSLSHLTATGTYKRALRRRHR